MRLRPLLGVLFLVTCVGYLALCIGYGYMEHPLPVPAPVPRERAVMDWRGVSLSDEERVQLDREATLYMVAAHQLDADVGLGLVPWDEWSPRHAALVEALHRRCVRLLGVPRTTALEAHQQMQRLRRP